MTARPHFVTNDDIREHAKDEDLRSVFRGIGEKHLSDDYVERVLGIPIHLRFAVERSMEEGHNVADDAFASIPFYSLCKGLFLPLSMLQPEAVAHYFGIQAPPPPDMAARELL